MTRDDTQTRLLIVSPCRDEADLMERTLASMAAQTRRPDLWVIVDDGSTDATPAILARFAQDHDWVQVLPKPDRGVRAVGPGVVEAFYCGLESVPDWQHYDFIGKFDLDLDLPPRYLEELMSRMEANPWIGTASGKPYIRRDGVLLSEKKSDELSVGMTKIWRTACFLDIGGLVPRVPWDAIDCHKARMKGWRAVSWDHPDLNFEHLRPMGSSQVSIYEGRRRHGRGQWFMGSDPIYFLATCVYRAMEPPYLTGGLASAQGYLRAWWRGEAQVDDPELRDFVRAYQRRALRRGRARAVAEIEAERAVLRGGPG